MREQIVDDSPPDHVTKEYRIMIAAMRKAKAIEDSDEAEMLVFRAMSTAYFQGKYDGIQEALSLTSLVTS